MLRSRSTHERDRRDGPASDHRGGHRANAHDGCLVDRTWRPKLKASVRPLVVVVAHVLVENPLKMTPTQISIQSKHSCRTVRTQRSATTLAFGAFEAMRPEAAPGDRGVDLAARSAGSASAKRREERNGAKPGPRVAWPSPDGDHVSAGRGAGGRTRIGTWVGVSRRFYRPHRRLPADTLPSLAGPDHRP
jgi:hypothetical protein